MPQARKMPRTGQSRKVRQPLSIDLLPMDLLADIERLRRTHGLGWLQIERLSSLPYNEKWEQKIGSAGFVNWDALPTRVLTSFPDLKLPHSNLQRWYDIRIEQAHKDVEAASEQARVIGKAFAQASYKGDKEAVMNAARDIAFQMLKPGESGQALVGDRLIDIAHVMQKSRANDLREERLKQNAEVLRLAKRKLDFVMKKAGELKEALEGTDGKPPVVLTREQLLEQVREIYGAV